MSVSLNAFVRNGELMTSGGAPFPVGGAWWTTYLDVKTGSIIRTDQREGLVDSVREPNTGGTFLAVRTDDRPEETLIVGGSGGTRARLYYDWSQIPNSVVVGPDAVYATGSSLVPPVTTVESPYGPIRLWAGFGHGVRRFPKDVSEGCITEAFLNVGIGFACPDWVATLDGTLATAPVLNPGGPELYVTTAGGNLYALDRADGSVLWSSALGSAGGEPALAEGRLYVPTASNGLQVFDAAGCGAATCTPDWTTAEGGVPSVAGDVLYLGGPTIRAYPADGCGAATCDPLWSADAGGTAGKVVVTGGRAYVGVTGRGVVSYSLST